MKIVWEQGKNRPQTLIFMEQIGEHGVFDSQRKPHFKDANKILMRNVRESGALQNVPQNTYIRYLKTINGRQERDSETQRSWYLNIVESHAMKSSN